MTFRISLLLILLTALLTACGGAEPPAQAQLDAATPAQPTEPAAPEPEAQAANDSAVVATVNGEPIARAEYDALLARRQGEASAADDAALETFVLNTLINEKLTLQAAERMEIAVTDDEIDAEISELKALIEGDEAAWQEWLQQNNYTEDAFREELRTQLITAKVRDAVVGDTPQQVQRQVHARHILVETEAEAQEIRNRLLNGESFVELAAQYSQDVTTRDEGGDLGWFAQGELLEPTVAEAAFSQEAGAVSEPVATRLGYHVIETLGFDDLPLQPEKQAQVAQSIFDEWLATQQDSAIIEINNG